MHEFILIHYIVIMETVTLKSIFESNKEELSSKLATLSLPKDSELIQKTVTNFLGNLFENEGAYRQNLTQSEDYILQAAFSFLNAQQSMVNEFASINKAYAEKAKPEQIQTKETPPISLKKEVPLIIGGTTVGGAAGALWLGSWGAVFGAIAGTALVLYYTSIQKPVKKSTSLSSTTDLSIKKEEKGGKIDVDKYLRLVGSICDTVDSLVLTFRAQINRVVDKYENQEKPIFEKEYGVLLDSIQSLLGVCYQPMDEKWQKKVKSRIEELAESLENYNLEVVMYDGSNSQYFEVIETENATSPSISLPAIIKNETLIKKGKVFIKKSVD